MKNKTLVLIVIGVIIVISIITIWEARAIKEIIDRDYTPNEIVEKDYIHKDSVETNYILK